MSTLLSETVIAHSKETARSFKADNTPGDWQGFPVVFTTPFSSDEVRIVAMASSNGVDAGRGTVAAVPIITAADRNGFTIQARNSDCAEGSAGMEWIAVLERPGRRSPVPVDIRTGVLQHKAFAEDCHNGDWNGWDYAFGNPMPSTPTAVATPIRHRGDFGVSAHTFGPFSGGTTLLELIPAPVGVAFSVGLNGISLAARNAGGWPGRAGMNFVAVATSAAPATGLVVDSGVTGLVSVPPTGGNISTLLDVNFSLPYLTPPVVLLTACDRGLPPSETAPAVQGIAESVTTHGFTLNAMNTDSVPGRAAFYWIAVGCSIHCGAGTRPGLTTVGVPGAPGPIDITSGGSAGAKP